MAKTRHRRDVASQLCCFMSSLKGKGVQRGSIGGACVICGNLQGGSPYSGSLWNQELFDVLKALSYKMSFTTALHCDLSMGSKLTIHTVDTTGQGTPHTFSFRGSFEFSNKNLMSGIQNMVRAHYAPQLRASDSAAALVEIASQIRGYLSILFSVKPAVEYDKRWPIQAGLYESNVDSYVRQHFLWCVLGQIQKLVIEIMAVLREPQQGLDERLLDLSAAVGVLNAGILHLLESIEKGKLQPIYGGEQVALVLKERFRSISDEILSYQQTFCGKFPQANWAAHLPDFLDIFKIAAETETISIILEIENNNTSTNIPQHSLLSTERLSVSGSLRSSISHEDHSLMNSNSSLDFQHMGPDFGNPSPHQVPVAEIFDPNTGEIQHLTYQNSAAFGPVDQWNMQPEHYVLRGLNTEPYHNHVSTSYTNPSEFMY